MTWDEAFWCLYTGAVVTASIAMSPHEHVWVVGFVSTVAFLCGRVAYILVRDKLLRRGR